MAYQFMRRIRQCLNKQLAELCQRSLQLEEISDKINSLLPPDLAPHCKAGNFIKGCLTLSTTDAVWASQLRYYIPELRDKLRKEAGLYQLISIKIAIADSKEPYQKPKRKKTSPSLSEEAKASIISESEHCSYQPLRKALMQLANNKQD